MLTLSTESRALAPEFLRLSVISSRGFCTSLIALLSIGKAYLSNAPGSLIGGPDISTAKSGNTGAMALALPGKPNVGTPVINPTANATDITHSLIPDNLTFCHHTKTKFHQHSSKLNLNIKKKTLFHNNTW